MEITFYNRTNQDMSDCEGLFGKIADRAEKVLRLKKNYEISVTFVRSRTIHSINREYRNIDRPTDVISFAIQDDEDAFDLEENDLGPSAVTDLARLDASEASLLVACWPFLDALTGNGGGELANFLSIFAAVFVSPSRSANAFFCSRFTVFLYHAL